MFLSLGNPPPPPPHRNVVRVALQRHKYQLNYNENSPKGPVFPPGVCTWTSHGKIPNWGNNVYNKQEKRIFFSLVHIHMQPPHPHPPHTVSLACSLSHLFLSYILSYTHTHTYMHTHSHRHTHTHTVMDTHMYKTQTQMAHWPFCLLWTTSRFVHERMWCFWWTFVQPRCHCSSRCLPHLLGQGHFPTEKVNAAHIHFKDMGLNSGGGGKSHNENKWRTKKKKKGGGGGGEGGEGKKQQYLLKGLQYRPIRLLCFSLHGSSVPIVWEMNCICEAFTSPTTWAATFHFWGLN